MQFSLVYFLCIQVAPFTFNDISVTLYIYEECAVQMCFKASANQILHNQRSLVGVVNPFELLYWGVYLACKVG
jgi:hypothetical protein